MNNYEDCPIGRNVQLNVAKMQKDIEYIKSEQGEVKSDIRTILQKLENMDKVYARKTEMDDIKREFNWVKTTAVTALLSTIGVLATFVINNFL